MLLVEKKAHLGWAESFHGNKISYVFLATAALASFAYPDHIELYAPGNSLNRRLAITRNPSDLNY